MNKEDYFKLTQEEKDFIDSLNDSLYTSKFVEEWFGRVDKVNINAPAALQESMVEGFMKAIRLVMKKN